MLLLRAKPTASMTQVPGHYVSVWEGAAALLKEGLTHKFWSFQGFVDNKNDEKLHQLVTKSLLAVKILEKVIRS